MKLLFVMINFILLFLFVEVNALTYKIGGIILTDDNLKNKLDNAPFIGIEKEFKVSKNLPLTLSIGISYSEGTNIDSTVAYYYLTGSNEISSTATDTTVMGNINSKIKVLNIPVSLTYNYKITQKFPKINLLFGAGVSLLNYKFENWVDSLCRFNYNMKNESKTFYKSLLTTGFNVSFTNRFSANAIYNYYFNDFKDYNYSNVMLTLNMKY